MAYDDLYSARHWQALDEENEIISLAKKSKTTFVAEVLSNGDTLKQLLARSRYLLFKHYSKWTHLQKQRAELLFERYSELEKVYSYQLIGRDI
ncbi:MULTISPECIES: transposase [unclassified Arcicella]|uniref:transposase n=1 Tax=unclassified Arcicella TaxID=2644986 RepID=UPI00285CF241|nr:MULTISPECIES: transposase [unclassified Arcicella]MDR6561275.1 hypothetical protein [Arcicella sp. BE51]MDR6811159.1 hypothetical protein [Arcicella sp. BE140]MDR6822509.1 hypothetical protein [Arcicella sp. BE139]